MDKKIRLSYLTATFNKLPYLRQGLEKLIANKKDDEEILVDDGGSTDGTKEYLEGLKKSGKIDFYISEPNYGESHSLNKLFPIAKGDLIKIINDDDCFYFPAIKACKEFMLAHPEIDILGAEGGSYKHASPSKMTIRQIVGYTPSYKDWQKNHTPFEFSVLGLMFRRSSLPLLGYWNHSFIMADVEFTFRATAGKANVAWYTGSTYVYIRNQNSITWTKKERKKTEVARLRKFHLNENPDSWLREKARWLREKFRQGFKRYDGPTFITPWEELYADAEKWLVERSKAEKPEFLYSKPAKQ